MYCLLLWKQHPLCLPIFAELPGELKEKLRQYAVNTFELHSHCPISRTAQGEMALKLWHNNPNNLFSDAGALSNLFQQYQMLSLMKYIRLDVGYSCYPLGHTVCNLIFSQRQAQNGFAGML